MTDDNVVGHVRPRANKVKQCEAWVELFNKFEGIEFEKAEWDAYGNVAFKMRIVEDEQ